MSTATVKMLDISTAHIREFTANELDAQLKAREGQLYDMLSYVAWHEYGWIFYVTHELIRELVSIGYPDLAACFEAAELVYGCQYLKLDCDGVRLLTLPTYDW